jgi:hypothetical protein
MFDLKLSICFVDVDLHCQYLMTMYKMQHCIMPNKIRVKGLLHGELREEVVVNYLLRLEGPM